ncbi:hypothetical protein [Nocardia sp. NPDC057440]|uniref:hypothetical protein n=1 Tax=Nocardia sp. NPDC057440 TaxID=3346134 RepID=UPI0036715608
MSTSIAPKKLMLALCAGEMWARTSSSIRCPYTACALIIYRNSKTKVDPDGNRRYGETNASEKVQLEADRKWWPIADARRRHLKAIAYYVDGYLKRVRAVDPDGRWQADDRGYWDVPVGPPMSEVEIAAMFGPHLQLGEWRLPVKGKLREYIPIQPPKNAK